MPRLGLFLETPGKVQASTILTTQSSIMEETSHKLNVTVVGAGLGGLAAAVCLGRQGHRVRVFESASELSELGAGIQIPPNAMRVLDAWGLKDEIENLGTHPNVESLRRFSNGKLVGQQRRNTKDAFGFEYVLSLMSTVFSGSLQSQLQKHSHS